MAASLPAVLAVPARAAPDSFQGFLAGLRAEARRAGISAATLDRAFAGVQPNQKVLERDRHQPEFTMTWAQYRALLITDQRIANGRAAWQQNRALLGRVQDRFGVDPGVITGIWGLESSFGTGMGDFHVVEALATLAWEGRRASFFRGELLAALRILDHGDVAPARMIGSYAGAMGQPQFMPSSYLRYAVDFEGHGRRDIWTSKPDVLGSIANYLAHSGWRSGEPWGQAVTLSANFDRHRDRPRQPQAGRRVGAARACVPADGRPLARGRYSGRAAAAGWTRRRCVPGLCELRRDPPLQPVGLLRAGGRVARRHARRMRLACALLLVLLAASCHRPPPANPHYVLGAPYQAGGIWYYPRESYEGQETGLAMVYPSGHAELTADGEAFDQTALAAAHQTLQLPAVARLTNLENGLQVLVRINDRGPATPHRLIEVTRRTATLLRFPADAAVRVRLEVLPAESHAAVDAVPGAPKLELAAAPRGEVQQTDLPPPGGAAASSTSPDHVAAGSSTGGRAGCAVAGDGDPGGARSGPIVHPARHVPELRIRQHPACARRRASARTSSARATGGRRRIG